MAELSIIQAISTGGNVAVFALLVMIWRQNQTINELKIELAKLKTYIELHEKGVKNGN